MGWNVDWPEHCKAPMQGGAENTLCFTCFSYSGILGYHPFPCMSPGRCYGHCCRHVSFLRYFSSLSRPSIHAINTPFQVDHRAELTQGSLRRDSTEYKIPDFPRLEQQINFIQLFHQDFRSLPSKYHTQELNSYHKISDLNVRSCISLPSPPCLLLAPRLPLPPLSQRPMSTKVRS